MLFQSAFSKCKVVEKRMNWGAGYGEIPVEYKLFGTGKTANWVEKSVRKVSEILRNLTANCTSNKLRKNIWVFLSLKLFLTLPLLYRKLFQKKFSFGIRKKVHLMTVRFINIYFIVIFLQEFDCKSICIWSYCRFKKISALWVVLYTDIPF